MAIDGEHPAAAGGARAADPDALASPRPGGADPGTRPKRNGQGAGASARLPAIAEDRDPLQRAPGEPLWPEVYSLEHLQRIRERQTNYYWRSLYQQDPIAEGLTEWPDSYFGQSIWFDEWPDECQCRTMALDPSKGRQDTGGWRLFGVRDGAASNRAGRCSSTPTWNIRNMSLISPSGQSSLMNTFRPHGFGVETNQFQELLAEEIARLAKPLNLKMPIYHLNNSLAKVVRIRSLTSLLAKGGFRFKRNSRGAKLLVQQLRDYPHDEHDDGPDALEMALRVMHACHRGAAEPAFTTQYVSAM